MSQSDTSFAHAFLSQTMLQYHGAEIFDKLFLFCFGTRGPIGSDEVVLRDASGVRHVFYVEVFYNGHEALTLAVYRRLLNRSVSG